MLSGGFAFRLRTPRLQPAASGSLMRIIGRYLSEISFVLHYMPRMSACQLIKIRSSTGGALIISRFHDNSLKDTHRTDYDAGDAQQQYIID